MTAVVNTLVLAVRSRAASMYGARSIDLHIALPVLACERGARTCSTMSTSARGQSVHRGQVHPQVVAGHAEVRMVARRVEVRAA